MSAAPTTFGVAPLDPLLGPIPPGGTLLLHHDPAVEAVPFLIQAAASHLRRGDTVCYLVTSRPPQRVRDAIEAEAPGAPGRLVLVDAYSALMGAATAAEFRIPNPNDPVEVAAWCDQAAKANPGSLLLVESLNVLVDRAGPERFAMSMPSLLASMKHFAFSASLWGAWPYGPDTDRLLDRFDAVLSLKGVEERVVLNQVVSVARTPWSRETAPPSLYRIVQPGGVVLHIPKVLITGPHGAGKSTFVQTVAEGSRSVERQGTTVALDRGTAKLSGVTVEVFGTPGQERFDPLLPTLAGQAVGVVVLVDATKPETFERAKEMLQKVWKRGLHVVIALNKQDLEGAMPLAQALAKLAAPAGVEVVTCRANDPVSARAVLMRLVDKVIRGGHP